MKTRTSFKILGALAIVGTIAGIAVFNSSASQSQSTFLVENDDNEDTKSFHNFLS